jgi:ABC-type Fe3+ transport system permease subunit
VANNKEKEYRIILPEFKGSESAFPDLYSRFSLKSAKAKDKTRKQLEHEDFSNEVTARRKYSWRVYRLVVLWLAFVGLVVLMQGFDSFSLTLGEVSISYKFDLSNEVLIALITSATASVIGLFTIIVRYFFSRANFNNQSEEKDP